jgi:hypothetical protein
MPVEKIPTWIERLLLPKLSEISGDIKAINARIDALESNMNTKFQAVDIKFQGVESRIDSLRNEINSKFEGTDIKIAELEKRMAMA